MLTDVQQEVLSIYLALITQNLPDVYQIKIDFTNFNRFFIQMF